MRLIWNNLCRSLLGRSLRRLVCEEKGATTLEWAMLLMAIAIPSVTILAFSLDLLVRHYRMLTAVNSLPFP